VRRAGADAGADAAPADARLVLVPALRPPAVAGPDDAGALAGADDRGADADARADRRRPAREDPRVRAGRL
jgi:hypothetical protein